MVSFININVSYGGFLLTASSKVYTRSLLIAPVTSSTVATIIFVILISEGIFSVVIVFAFWIVPKPVVETLTYFIVDFKSALTVDVLDSVRSLI